MTDVHTPEQRRRNMQAIRSKDTGIELTVAMELRRQGIAYRRHVADLPGKPDFVIRKQKIVVFVDGDFWHGWRYPLWKHRLSDFWQNKIERNRRRDRLNFQRLRRKGWTVVRIWEHTVKECPQDAVKRILVLLDQIA